MNVLLAMMVVVTILLLVSAGAYAREVEFEDASAAVYLPAIIDSQPTEQAQLSAEALESFGAPD